MAEEPLFKSPSEEEITQGLRGQSFKDIDWKAATLVVAGIAQEPEKDEEFPILYSIARWHLDLNRYYPAHLKYQYGPTVSEYWVPKRHTTDEEGNVVFKEDEGGNVTPIPLKETGQTGEYIKRMKEVPQELLGEEYDESRVIDYEDPEVQELLTQSRGIISNWYALGKAFIYRKPTGKYYNPSLNSSKTFLIGQAVQAIRNIFWTIKLPMGPSRHTPYHQIDPEKVHQLIFERLQTAAAQLRKIISQNDTSDYEGGFLDYKVAVLEPKGVEGFFDSVEQALVAVAEHYLAEINQGEPMAAAAKLSKEHVKTLIAAADILDKIVPAGANLIDEVLKVGDQQSFENGEFKKEDLVAALTRVADKLDKEGAIAEANLADKLLESIVSSEELSRKLQM